MNIFMYPTGNALLNTFLRSVVLFLALVFGGGTSYYTAYWAAIVHDTISLVLIRPLM